MKEVQVNLKVDNIVSKDPSICGLDRNISRNPRDRALDLEIIIIQAKFAYYEGSKYQIEPIFTDTEYDSIETEYSEMCIYIGKEPFAKNMVGFERSSFSEICANMVLVRMGSPYRFRGSPMEQHPKNNTLLIE